MLAIDLAALDARPFHRRLKVTAGRVYQPTHEVYDRVGRSAPAFQARPLISGRESELAIAT